MRLGIVAWRAGWKTSSGDFLALVLKLIEPIIDALPLKQFGVRANFADFAPVHDEDFVRILNG